ncbi:hypothetical protein, unlikely [Trypanosoma brucei gambiense DAL972]|uniref:Uncharacterized protein n=1 Tax=Trypanosoma brucei gambiense (strain MHOM/CI/86/DAL972) TaxID=679716 RepID=C9ZX06_TRYB9|nr:hypothetical protein, unlikely [Trypanosoma brucei gambiense DAL972]CBH13947.1 hypothetical protein, unlikely [Trypanosoma brucei gambiense DAL972]|eukprot:XP_011776221.1 hypothetical protein, unlikely [Trypanosoma brucei gambiense DAL972]
MYNWYLWGKWLGKFQPKPQMIITAAHPVAKILCFCFCNSILCCGCCGYGYFVLCLPLILSTNLISFFLTHFFSFHVCHLWHHLCIVVRLQWVSDVAYLLLV